MQATTIHQSPDLSVFNFRCTAKPGDKPYAEVHRSHSLTYVRRGSFGCRTLGKQHELVAGDVLVGRLGQEYMATHEHHECGDECLSVKLSPELADFLEAGKPAWDLARLPPLPQLIVLGELAQAAAEGRSDVGADEAAMLFAGKFAETARGKEATGTKTMPRDRRRAVEAALWIDENAAEEMSLEEVAREVGLSAFHFLRVFSKVLGVTPHQYLVRTRLRRAVRGERAIHAGFGAPSPYQSTRRVAIITTASRPKRSSDPPSRE